MVVDIVAADAYFDEFVLNNEVWKAADEDVRKRALNNAFRILSRQYPRREIPVEAVFEQAVWIMKITEARKQSAQGVVAYSIDGISVTLSQVDRSISPEVFSILGRRVGQSLSTRQGYIVSSDEHVPGSGQL